MRLEDEIKQTSFQNQKEKAVLNILYTSSWVETKQKAFFKTYNITNQQYNILRILRGQNPEPCTINILKDRMIDKMSDTSRLTDRLFKKGLIKKETSKEDKRASLISISENGLKLLSELDSKINYIHSILDHLSDQELNSLNVLLDKVRI